MSLLHIQTLEKEWGIYRNIRRRLKIHKLLISADAILILKMRIQSVELLDRPKIELGHLIADRKKLELKHSILLNKL